VAGLPGRAGQLVHDPRPGAEIDVLGAPAQQGEPGRFEHRAGEGQGKRHLEGGGRGEAGANRNLRRDHALEAADLHPLVPKRTDQRAREPLDPGRARLVERANRDDGRARLVERANRDEAFAPLPDDVGGELERHRQHEAVVVVRVLADQVRAPGRAERLLRARDDAEQAFKWSYAHISFSVQACWIAVVAASASRPVTKVKTMSLNSVTKPSGAAEPCALSVRRSGSRGAASASARATHTPSSR